MENIGNHNKKRTRHEEIYLRFLLTIILLLSAANVVSAAEMTTATEIRHLDDGSYFVIETIQPMARSANTTSGFKRITYVDTDGETRWRAILTGTFTYDGTTYIYASNWYEVSKTAGKSGNTATGSVTMGRTVLGFTVAQETYNMTLICSPTGVLS